MNLIWLLLQASWVNVAVAVLTGLISGGCSARLTALINSAVNEQSTTNLLWYFVGLAVVALLTSIVSQVLLISLAQEAVYHLRLRLSRGILSSPLRHLEELGASRLLATLTGDVQTLSNTIFVIPFLCIDIAIIAGCLIYLSWLSGVVFLIVIVFLGVAIASTQLMLTHARKFLSLAREEEDKLFKHFRAITEGIKELKLHALRRQAFLSDELQISAATSRDYNSTAFKTFAIATGWGNLLFFTIVGLLLFVLPQVATVSTPVLSAYILTITYLLVPFQNILERLPALFRANVALQKVERMKLALARKYLQKLHLNTKVQVKDGLLSTTALSQGQRKRLALLTVFLEDRPIYLFDEWASDQDPYFRDIFYKELLLNLKQRGKTIIVISHDDRYFHLADRVIKLDYGKVEYDSAASCS